MKFDKILLMTSPFLRCIQTADGIAQELNHYDIEVNWLICEHLQTMDFPDYDPLPHLEYNNLK